MEALLRLLWSNFPEWLGDQVGPLKLKLCQCFSKFRKDMAFEKFEEVCKLHEFSQLIGRKEIQYVGGGRETAEDQTMETREREDRRS